jgi:hypothetical protein
VDSMASSSETTDAADGKRKLKMTWGEAAISACISDEKVGRMQGGRKGDFYCKCHSLFLEEDECLMLRESGAILLDEAEEIVPTPYPYALLFLVHLRAFEDHFVTK